MKNNLQLKTSTINISSSDTCFISDVHLCEHEQNITNTFLDYLDSLGNSKYIKNLFILGDLFEYWIGDDDCKSEFNQKIISALKNIKNINKYFIKGNRDFLIGDIFSELADIQILDDPSVIYLDNQRILISHGDIFCTDDYQYQIFRNQVRSKSWQDHFLSQPLEFRRNLANQLRIQSNLEKSNKSYLEMDINVQALDLYMKLYQCVKVIHGHTHRPNIHQHDFYFREVLKSW